MEEIEDRGRKIMGKSAGIMENGVMRILEETWDHDDNCGGRYVVCWG